MNHQSSSSWCIFTVIFCFVLQDAVSSTHGPGSPGMLLSFKGQKGEKGMNGSIGQPGLTGALGRPGRTGDRGWRGDPGIIGYPGMEGERGETCIGRIGPMGRNGLDGEPGEPAAKNDSVMGAKGPNGEQGCVGIPGIQGKDGEVGPPGEEGDQAPERTNKGCKGYKGRKGDRGKTGVSANDVTISSRIVAAYTIWGKGSCPKTASQSHSGIAAYGNERESFCFSTTEKELKGDPHDIEELPEGIQAIKISNDPGSSPSEFLVCALCSAKERLTVITVPLSQCPNDKDWIREYTGFLTIPPNSEINYICVAESAGGFILNNSKIPCSVCSI